ncbi:hypothetical protein OIU84_014873 [Salix udensis]|uniref:PHD finger family protein n=1 Tax=Salix udensis TaxID=889485 RepID=A0AAD6NS31_9ROSI|nr:hypothetical protein OIU84_014873 [Salix udensis]
MAKAKAKAEAPRRTLDSYTVKPINITVKPGDCVLMRPSDPSKPSYVAKIERIESRGHSSADTIEGKCTVHSFKNYTTLDAVGNDDFFCRFEYNSSSGAFNPESVAVYCKCEMPYNPDDLMVQCEGCSDWFHPACIEMSAEEAKRLGHFFCEKCSSEGPEEGEEFPPWYQTIKSKGGNKEKEGDEVDKTQMLMCNDSRGTGALFLTSVRGFKQTYSCITRCC